MSTVGVFAQNTILSAMENLMTHFVFIIEGGKKYTIRLGRQQIKVIGGTHVCLPISDSWVISGF